MTLKQRMLVVVRKVDRNTRAVAKLRSAVECVRDNDQITISEQGRAITVLDELLFVLIQERRTMRCDLEDLLKQQTGWGT